MRASRRHTASHDDESLKLVQYPRMARRKPLRHLGIDSTWHDHLPGHEIDQRFKLLFAHFGSLFPQQPLVNIVILVRRPL